MLIRHTYYGTLTLLFILERHLLYGEGGKEEEKKLNEGKKVFIKYDSNDKGQYLFKRKQRITKTK